MKLIMILKGSKFDVVNDRDKKIYTIKKKILGNARYILKDKNNYELYVLQPITGGKRPAFNIMLNEKLYLDVKCTSMFLDPSIEASGEGGHYLLKSADRKNFDMIIADKNVGNVKILTLLNGDTQVEAEINDKAYDDVIPLLALCTELTFGHE